MRDAKNNYRVLVRKCFFILLARRGRSCDSSVKGTCCHGCKVFQNMGETSKFFATAGWHAVSFILRISNIGHHIRKFSSYGDLSCGNVPSWILWKLMLGFLGVEWSCVSISPVAGLGIRGFNVIHDLKHVSCCRVLGFCYWWFHILSLWILHVKVQVKFTLEQAMKAQRGSRGIALLFL